MTKLSLPRFRSVFLLILALGLLATTAKADEHYWILEVAPDGSVLTRPAEIQKPVAGLDPVTYHELFSRTAAQGASQILWLSTPEQVVIDLGRGASEYDMVVSAALPPRADLMYQAWSIADQKLADHFTHVATGPDWGVDPERLAALPDGEYMLQVMIRMPDQVAPTRAQQRILIRGGKASESGGRPSIRPRPGAGWGGGKVGDGYGPTGPIEVGPLPEWELAADGRIIYVSASEGNDANNGLTPQTAVRTLDRGYALVRDGKPDWMLLKRGDVFALTSRNSNDFRAWAKSGRSPLEPMILGTYGDAELPRPRIDTNGHGVFYGLRADNLVIRDLHLYANLRDPNNPSYDKSNNSEVGVWVNSAEGLVLLNCMIEYFKGNIVMQDYPEPDEPTLRDIRMHRCVVRNSYSHGDTDSSGMFVNFASGFVVTECIFDHNGWNEQVEDSHRRGRNHNAYFSHCHGVALVGNVFARGSYEDVKFRCEDGEHPSTGILVQDNLFLACAYAIGFDTNNGDGRRKPTVYRNVEVTGNVFAQTLGWPLDNPGGPAMRIGWMLDGNFTNNLYCDPDPRNERPQAIEIKLNTPMENIAVTENTAALADLPAFYVFPSTANANVINFTNNSDTNPLSDLGQYLHQVSPRLSVDGLLQLMAEEHAGDDPTLSAAGIIAYYRSVYLPGGLLGR
jgi:hypothetical protein